MITFNQYVRAASPEEAYELNLKKNNVIVGGMLWLKMTDRQYGTAIDLCDLGLQTIEEDDEYYSIGAMVTLRQLEQHEGLNTLTGGVIRNSVEHIVGVQFRNCATVGGSIYGRFGFSDVLTLFLALRARVELVGAGVMELADFTQTSRQNRDVLLRILVPKDTQSVVYLSQRNSSTDFPVLAVAAGKSAQGYVYSVGARPHYAMPVCSARPLCGEEAAEKFTFGSNLRASAQYRKQICKVLVDRAMSRL